MKIDWKKEIKMPRLSLSWLKSLFARLRGLLNRGPSINLPGSSIKGKGPSVKRPKALSKGPQIKMPRLVTDLYGDLRERHLLPLVILLIAAIVAAPILLGNKSDKKEPTAVAPIAGEAATSDSSFSVVPAARKLRSPSKRLGHRQALDPFRVDSKAAEGESSGTTETGGGSEGSSSGGSEAAATGSSSGGAPATETTTTESPPTTTEHTTTTTTGNVTVQVNVIGYVAVIKAGDVSGEPTEEREIAPVAKLPSKKEPLVVFTGLTPDAKRAQFLMTSKPVRGSNCSRATRRSSVTSAAAKKSATRSSWRRSNRSSPRTKSPAPNRSRRRATKSPPNAATPSLRHEASVSKATALHFLKCRLACPSRRPPRERDEDERRKQRRMPRM